MGSHKERDLPPEVDDFGILSSSESGSESESESDQDYDEEVVDEGIRGDYSEARKPATRKSYMSRLKTIKVCQNVVSPLKQVA